MSEIRIPRPPGAVLFDLDGVLVDTFEAWVAVVDRCRERRGLPPLGPGPVGASWGQGLQADCESFFPGEDPSRLAREYDEIFSNHLDSVRAFPGVREAVEAFRDHSIPQAVVTNSPVAIAREILVRVGLAEALATIAGGDEVARSKPAPDLVHLALKRLGAGPERAVLVGDTSLDVEAARAAGVTAIGFRRDGDARVDDLRDLPALLGVPPPTRL